LIHFYKRLFSNFCLIQLFFVIPFFPSIFTDLRKLPQTSEKTN